MRTVLVGQKWFGAEVLKLLARRGDHVALVAAPAAEGEEYDRLHAAAQQAGIPVLAQAGRITAADIPPACDLIIAAHSHAFIASEAISAARLGAIGYHPSLLPRHRGRDAVRWAIHMREPVTGGTVYWLDDGADTGPVAAQDWCHVRPGDSAADLWRRDLAPLGLKLLARVLDDLDSGRVVREVQDPALATWEPAFHRARFR
jgi:methionyl-tRNA formyltransferase